MYGQPSGRTHASFSSSGTARNASSSAGLSGPPDSTSAIPRSVTPRQPASLRHLRRSPAGEGCDRVQQLDAQFAEPGGERELTEQHGAAQVGGDQDAATDSRSTLTPANR